MFTCNCGKSFEKQGSLTTHARFCSEYVKANKPVSKYKIGNFFVCECGRSFDKGQGLNGHFSVCLIHREGKPWVNKGKGGGWSKGLTKETHPGVKRWCDAGVLARKGKPGKPHTLEMRKHLSEKRIAYLESSPHIKWFEVSNGERLIKVQGTWEKRVADWLNDNSIKWDRRPVRFKHRKYTPDFWLPEHGVYIEVKGWLSDRDINKMRDVISETSIKILILQRKELDNLGILTIRDLPEFK